MWALGMAFLFEVKINYGVGFAMPLSVGFGLLYLTLLTLQFSFATLAIKSSTINLDLHSSTRRSSAFRAHHRFEWAITGRCVWYFVLVHIPFMIYIRAVNLFCMWSMIRDAFYGTSLMCIALGFNIWWIVHCNHLDCIEGWQVLQIVSCRLSA